MRRNIIVVFAGLIAFLIAGASVSLIQMTIGALVPGRSPVPEGKLDPSPEQQLKTTESKQEPTTTETTTESKQQEATPTPEQPSVVEEPAANPEPQPIAPPPPAPRALTTGPGNFDAPQPYYPPAGAQGPGNM